MGWTDEQATRTASWIRAARQSRGFTNAKDLADTAGIGRSTLSAIENGKGYSTTTLTQKAIEEALKVPHGTLQQVAAGEETRMPADIPHDTDEATVMVEQLSAQVADLERRLRTLERSRAE